MNLIHSIKAIVILPVWLILCASRKEDVGTLYEEAVYARPWTIAGGISFWTLVLFLFAILERGAFSKQILLY